MSWMKAKQIKVKKACIESAAQRKYAAISVSRVVIVTRRHDNEFVGEFRSIEQMIRRIPPSKLPAIQWATFAR